MHARHARDLVGVFREVYEARFPIRRLHLVDAYGGDDNRSMAADNSSACWGGVWDEADYQHFHAP